MTAIDLITSAYRLVGVLAANQTASGSRAAVGLEALNMMIDAWNIEGSTLFTVSTITVPLVSGTASYTLGPTGSTVVGARPPVLESAVLRDTVLSTDRILTILSAADYSQISYKSLQSSDPVFLYYEPSFPNGTLTLFPVPNTTGRQVILQYTAPLSSNLALNDVINLPPAYMRALRFNLAIALAVEAGRQDVNPGIMQIAYESKTMLERANARVPTLSYYMGMGGTIGTIGLNVLE